MRVVVTLALACLAGCATLTPAELVEQGYRYDFGSSKSARDAALCVAKNMENFPGGGITASMRERETPGTWQILWTAPSHALNLGVIFVDPAAQGSRITMHLNPGIRSQYDQRAKDFSQGC
jgi:hypothetical protein